ncbi:hypothetical protein AB0L05_42145 [Nonomuraea pusilla]|uniref:hypothetical protein n=1 Tax=Nonomuraea pusilla TaxID=46177 RepID=UPI00331A4551
MLNSKGQERIELPAAPMMDAAAMNNPDTGKVGQAPIEIDGDTAALKADNAFLTDPNVTYPITVQTGSGTWVGTGIDGDTHVSNEVISEK